MAKAAEAYFRGTPYCTSAEEDFLNWTREIEE